MDISGTFTFDAGHVLDLWLANAYTTEHRQPLGRDPEFRGLFIGKSRGRVFIMSTGAGHYRNSEVAEHRPEKGWVIYANESPDDVYIPGDDGCEPLIPREAGAGDHLQGHGRFMVMLVRGALAGTGHIDF